jgi:ubiquinone/menaquinone biosynthesis C-methylase UbiE
MTDNDLKRLRKEYESRKLSDRKAGYYSMDYPPNAFSIDQRTKALRTLLLKHGEQNYRKKLLLEIGCGSGGILKEYSNLGFQSSNLFGIDLLLDRLEEARINIPPANLVNSDGQMLPFPSGTFDLVVQYTAFSSILEPSIKKKMALEMLRALKNDGQLIWYDFWWNPLNKQTLGIKPGEIKALFPGCTYKFKKITLAPPIARRVVPISVGLATFLETLQFLNSHYLVLISK